MPLKRFLIMLIFMFFLIAPMHDSSHASQYSGRYPDFNFTVVSPDQDVQSFSRSLIVLYSYFETFSIKRLKEKNDIIIFAHNNLIDENGQIDTNFLSKHGYEFSPNVFGANRKEACHFISDVIMSDGRTVNLLFADIDKPDNPIKTVQCLTLLISVSFGMNPNDLIGSNPADVIGKSIEMMIRE